MLELNITSIIFTVINVIIIYIILNFMLFRKMNKNFARRAAAIDAAFEEAAEKGKQADEVAADYTQKIAAVEVKEAEVLKEARVKADEEAKKITDAAHDQATKIVEDARDAAVAQKNQIMSKAEKQLADMVVEATSKLVANQKGADVDAALFDEFLNNKAGDKQ